VWAASTTNARVVPSIAQGIEPFQVMMTAKELPTVEFADYNVRVPPLSALSDSWSPVPGRFPGNGSSESNIEN
jgi:hypothetical protein